MRKNHLKMIAVLLVIVMTSLTSLAQEKTEIEEKKLGLASIPHFQPRLWFNVPVVGIAMPNGVAEFMYGKKRLKFGLGGGYETFNSENTTFNRSHLFLTQLYYFATPDYYAYYLKMNEGMPLNYNNEVRIEESWYLAFMTGLKGSLENKFRFFVELGISLNYLDYQFPIEGEDWSQAQQSHLWRPVLNFGISL